MGSAAGKISSSGVPFTESALDPDLPIVDPHHHLWAFSLAQRQGKSLSDPNLSGFERQSLMAPRYLLDELLADTGGGHNIRSTVFVQAHAMYRADGPKGMAPVGETEFVNGVAAMSASGDFGTPRLVAGIVGFADLSQGEVVQDLLEAHMRAGGERFKGIRQGSAYDADKSILGALFRGGPGALQDPEFYKGFARLEPLGLSFDAWMLEPQLPDLVELARAFPGTEIVLDHVGTPLGIGDYARKRQEVFERWRGNIRRIAECPNVTVKLGGLGMQCIGFDTLYANPRATSAQLAKDWAPYFETCIEAFGAERCMFESNFPVDNGTCDYVTLWNTFKRIVAGASADEKAAMFAGTARRVYRLAEV